MANVKGSNSTNKMTVKPTGNPVTYSVRTDVNNNKIVTNASKETNTFAIKDNMSEYYARLSESFACGNGIINGVDYSSKYYASLSKEHAETAEEQKNAAIEAMDSFDSDVQAAKADIEQTRLNSIDSVNVLYDSILEGVESARTNAIESLDQETENNKQEINALADVIKDNADSIINRVGLNMFDTVLKDHVLTYEESKGLALQGTWVYKEAIAGERYGYPDFYNTCVKEFKESTTATENNITVTGTIANNNGVISGFSADNYAILPDTPDGVNSFEIFFKCTTGADFTNNQLLYGQSSNTNYATPQLQLGGATKQIWCGVSVDGATWTTVCSKSDIIEPNTTYYSKLVWNNKVVKLYVSTTKDITEQHLVGSNTLDNLTWSIPLGLGFDQNPGNGAWLGNIDLNECYIDINGSRWWDGVRLRRHSNGHYYYPISAKATIDSRFNSNGAAWYYGIDEVNERIFMPRNNWFMQMASNSVGSFTDAGLPNITGEITPANDSDDTIQGSCTGAFYRKSSEQKGGVATDYSKGGTYGIGINASRSSTVYGKSTTVQPKSVKQLLYICVGNQVQDNSWVNVIEQVKNGAKEIDDERIKALNNIETDRASAVTSVNTAYNSAMKTLQAVGPVLQTGSTMTGPLIIKTASNPALNYHCGRFDLTTNPDSTVSAGLTISDKAGTRIGMLECQQMANGSKHTSINTMYTKEDGTKAYASIQVGYDVNGNAYTSAPTPAAGDNSTKIATTAFVKQAADGQWVKVTPKVLSSATAVGTYTIDLSSTLTTTGCQHEVLLALRGTQGSDSWTVGRIFVTSSLVAEHSYANVMSTGSDKYQDDEFATGIVPVGTDRKIYMNIRDLGYSTVNLVLFAYRRLGTNK